MTLSELLPPSHILIGIAGGDREAVLARFAALLEEVSHGHLPADVLRARLIERERARPTALGFGVALPHAKAPKIDKLYVAAATAIDGVNFDASDGVPCKLLFCVIAPDDQPALHLKALALISKLTRDKEVRDELLAASSPEEFHAVLKKVEAPPAAPAT